MQTPSIKTTAGSCALAVLLAATVAPAGSTQHQVSAGETLSSIASAYGAQVDDIAAANDIADVDRIVAGQVLSIPGPEGTTHVVAAGETLAVIAAQHDVSVGELASANGIADPNLIIEGATLVIPGSSDTGAASAATVHTVAAGDTLALIAARYGVTVADLAAANGIADVDYIVVGTAIAVDPAATTAPPAAARETESAVDPEPQPEVVHTVAPGETLAAVAARYEVTVAALAAANAVTDVDFVREGTILTVPAAPAPEAEPEPTPEPAPADESPAAGAVTGTAVAPLLDKWAAEYEVPPALFKALTWFESGWNNSVVSEVGAVGIGQLMPATVEFVGTYLIGRPIDPTVVEDNVQASARFLQYLLDQTGRDARMALAAYYQGLTALRRDGIYESSVFYVEGILALTARF